MSTLLNDTMDAAKNTIETAKDGTQHAVSSAQHAVSSARSGLLDGIHAVGSVVSILRGFGLTDALGLVGLTQKRGPFESIAIFGAGVAVGTGVGFLFAPAKGYDTRRKIFGMFMNMEKDAEAGAKKIEEKAEDLVGKAKDTAEDLAGKAKDAVMDAEKKVENKVGKSVDTVKETIKGKVESAADAVKETTDNAKNAVTGSDILRQSNDAGNGRTSHARH